MDDRPRGPEPDDVDVLWLLWTRGKLGRPPTVFMTGLRGAAPGLLRLDVDRRRNEWGDVGDAALGEPVELSDEPGRESAAEVIPSEASGRAGGCVVRMA